METSKIFRRRYFGCPEWRDAAYRH